jgi:hypothetical protein
MMNPVEVEVKCKADEINASETGDDSLIINSEMISEIRMLSLAEVMSTVKQFVGLEASHAGLRGRSRELEAKVGALEKLLSNVMSTNRELKLKLDEMFIELDVVKKMEARLAAAVAEMRAPISHFGNVANYAQSGEGTQPHALASTYRYHID